MDFERMVRDPVRSTVRMYFTVLQTFELLLSFDKELRERYVNAYPSHRVCEEALKDLVRQLNDGVLKHRWPPMTGTDI